MAGSSSSDQGVSHFKYDVFLSFRGYTRLRFTDALYHALINNGIDTFRDNDKLRIGKELEGALLEAIESSRMSILIPCDEYPTSKWCLDELVKIMECSENGRKRPVLPVYYYVERSDVQYQLNEYAKAMTAHEEKGRYNHKLEAWRSALSEVGKIYGQRCDQNTPFGMAINKIVEEVIKRLPPLPLYIHRPLGCDSELEEAKSLLQIGSSHACRLMLGIHGDGDLSQFVAELYNKIRCDFASASFLSGITGEIDWFGPGSRIIITTRYEDVLDEHAGVDIKKYRFDEGEFEGNGGSSTMMEENVVGLEEDFNVIINQLKEEDSARNVVSIVGMGGLGKTTLARKVYNSDEARELFPCRAWATVSKECMPTEVFKELLKCLKVPEADYENAGEEKLKDMVRKRLNGKKYLVVLDDVWEANVWDKLKGPLPDNNNGSMILVTTRNDQMANYTRSKEPHHQLHLLDEDQSWEMFRNKVFGREECPPPLELIGRSIAFESCKGLPLAIKTIAGIVAKKERSEDAWEEIKNLLPYWSVAEDKEGEEMMKILKYSYDDLSEKMKPCFLYLGVFLEDAEILVRDLIQLWMSEDFIKPIQTGRRLIEPEDIGEQYLKELVDRNLVQVVKRRSDGKGVKACQIHDLIRDLCILVSNDNPDNSNNARTFTFSRSEGSYACSVTCNHSSTCSLFVYGDVDGWSHHIPEGCPVNVLYLNGFDGLPNEKNAEDLERLKSLKFLKMDCLVLHRLFKLQSLQTIQVNCIWKPKKISVDEGLKQMRHFRCPGLGGEQLLLDERVKERMQNFQTLCYVYADSQLGLLLNNGYFPNLRTLGLLISEDECQLVDENLRSLLRLSELRVSVSSVTLEAGAMSRLRSAVFRQCLGLTLQSLPERMLSLEFDLHFIEPDSDDDDERRRRLR
ncbi:uncharacterized protein DS421_14g483080 [Arachis hypogaea]|nr:uncharacterized protein DS421_14g483080 [Arachis hypogaea]